MMKCRRFRVVWSLFAACLVSTGCLSEEEEAVPKVDYGQSVVQSEVGKATAPQAPYDPNRAFNQLDRDGDQALDLSEFSQGARTQQARTRESHVFRAVDRDQDGRVSPDEFTNRPPEADYRNKDTDSDGMMSFAEFRTRDMGWASEEHAKRVFTLTDRDDSGTLDLNEFRTRPSEVWFARTDRNGDDLLSLAEYEAVNGGLVQNGRSKLVFGLLDQDSDGKLALTEFVNSPPEESFYKRDRDADDALSLIEFSVWCTTEEDRSSAAAAFEAKDCDENGLMSLTEFKLSPAEANFRRLDSDGDGKLGLEEFAAEDSTAEALARATRVFSVRDANEDGSLSREEYDATSNAVTFFERDADGDGSWDAEEFHRADMAKASPEWALRTFEIMDRNDDGKMSLEERSGRAWFMFIDVDENGSLSEAEYGGFNPWLIDIGHCKTVFDLMDRDKDGGVSHDEFNNKPPEVEFLKRDRSGDSMLSLEEFMTLIASNEKTPAVMKAFNEKDSNRDGRLSIQEYLATPEERQFRAIDTDGDGALSVTEYMATDEASGSESYVQGVFKARDGNGDGMLQPAEYRATSPAIAFAKKDLDGDGTWNVEEFHQADMVKASSEWARRTFEIMDRNKDGKMSPDEQSARTDEVWFMLIDADESESVTPEEYGAFNSWLVKLGHAKTICGYIDRNGDGIIEMAEFTNKPPEVEFLKRDSSGNSMLSLKEFLTRSRGKERIAADTAVFLAKDADGNGELSVEEYLASPEQSRFRKLDSNKDGVLDSKEYASAVEAPADESHAARVFKARDANGDEQLQFEEFVADGTAIRFAKLDGDGDSRLNQEEYLAGKTGDAVIRLERDLFPLRDSDGDGHLTESEFTSTSPAIAFRIKDLNGDGAMDLDEFHRGDMPDASAPCARRAFEATDTDDSGAIEPEEIRTRPAQAWFARMDTNLDDNLSQEEFAASNASIVRTKRVKPLLALMDVNGDGNITEAEYCLDSPEIVFIRKDENGDGKLQFNEYSVWSGTPEKLAQAKAEFDRRDIDKDESLTFREYMVRAEEIDFWAFDGDGDHRLSLEEFCLSPTLVAGVSGNAPVDAVTDLSQFPQDGIAWQRLFATVDTNGDGLVAFDEFRRKPLKWRFLRLDVDGDGAISLAELSTIDGIPDISKSLGALIHHRDLDENQSVTLQEFLGEAEPVKADEVQPSSRSEAATE